MMPQEQSQECLALILRMLWPGLNTVESCGILLVRPVAPSTVLETFQEVIALCWQRLLNSSFTISNMQKLQNVTNGF